MPFEETVRPLPWPMRPDPGERLSIRRDFVIAEIHEWASTHGGRQPTHADWNIAVARRRNKSFERGWPSTQMVIDAFGCWAEGIAAAGFTPYRAGRRRTPASEARARHVLALRGAGFSHSAIARELGLQKHHVGASLKTAKAMGLRIPPVVR